MSPVLGVLLLHACAAAWITCMPVTSTAGCVPCPRLPCPGPPHGMDSGAPNSGPGSIKLYASNSLHSGLARRRVQDKETTFPPLL